MVRYLFGFILSCVLSAGFPLISAAASTDTGDKAAVIDVLNHFVDAWNRHDMNALASVFSEDADFVNVIGQRWIGRKAIKEAHAANHETIFKQSQLTVEESSVSFLTPRIAVLRAITKLSGELDRAGHTGPPRFSLPTFVMKKSDRKWLVVIAQNTDINTDISPIKPSK